MNLLSCFTEGKKENEGKKSFVSSVPFCGNRGVHGIFAMSHFVERKGTERKGTTQGDRQNLCQRKGTDKISGQNLCKGTDKISEISSSYAWFKSTIS